MKKLTLRDLLINSVEAPQSGDAFRGEDRFDLAEVHGIYARAQRLLPTILSGKFLSNNIDIEEWAVSISGSLQWHKELRCYGYSLPEYPGSIRRSIEGTKGSVERPVTIDFPAGEILGRNLDSLEHPRWVLAMSVLITCQSEEFFHWHRGGDIQGIRHLAMISGVARMTPHIKHWLPTLERDLLRRFFRAGGRIPENLVIRLSSLMLDDGPPKLGSLAEMGIRASCESLFDAPDNGSVECSSTLRDFCSFGCRKCWSKDIKSISHSWR